jgi:hypothetical protein
VELFDVADDKEVRSARPTWARRVRTFADFNPDPTKLVSWFARDEKGQPTKDVHPEIRQINMADVPPQFRGSVIKDINKKKIKQMFDDHFAA